MDCDTVLVTRSPIAIGAVPYSAPPRERVLRLLRAVGEQPVRVQKQARAQDLRHYHPVEVGHSNRKPPRGSVNKFFNECTAVCIRFERPCRCGETADVLLVTPDSCASAALNLDTDVPGMSFPHG